MARRKGNVVIHFGAKKGALTRKARAREESERKKKERLAVKKDLEERVSERVKGCYEIIRRDAEQKKVSERAMRLLEQAEKDANWLDNRGELPEEYFYLIKDPFYPVFKIVERNAEVVDGQEVQALTSLWDNLDKRKYGPALDAMTKINDLEAKKERGFRRYRGCFEIEKEYWNAMTGGSGPYRSENPLATTTGPNIVLHMQLAAECVIYSKVGMKKRAAGAFRRLTEFFQKIPAENLIFFNRKRIKEDVMKMFRKHGIRSIGVV